MKIVKVVDENKREFGLNEKGDITELIIPEYIIRFDDKEEYEKAEPIIMEAVELGFDVYHGQTTASKLTYDNDCGKVYATNGTLVSFIENKNFHELKEIMKKIMMTSK